MRIFFLIVLLMGFVQLNGQKLFNGTKKISNARGTFFMHWGYNRSFYTQSDIEFNNAAYKFSLRNVSASDSKTENFGDFFRLNTFFNPQYSVKAGYYYMNHYAFTFGLDHMKYIMNDGNQVLLDGSIDSTLNSGWQGNYKNQEVVTNANDFHFQYVGLNTIHLGLIRTDKLYQSKNKTFALSASYGLQLATVVSNTSLAFANTTSTTRALTGYNISVLANLRFEFFRVLYIQGQIGGGSINQVNAKTDSDDVKSYAKNQFWYGQRQINIGFFHYFKPANGCNDCPVW